jgi:[ribosomal protein S5]-alanine N-acetyltransferase
MIIRTQRLVLRPPVEADAGRITELINDFDIARMTGRVPFPYSRQNALDWLGIVASGREQPYAIIEAGALIGVCGYSFGTARLIPEVGYWLGRAFWGQGYATEATQALIRHGFATMELTGIVIAHMADNPASARVIAKCGFVTTGERVTYSLARGRDVRSLTYAITRPQAEAQPWCVSP